MNGKLGLWTLAALALAAASPCLAADGTDDATATGATMGSAAPCGSTLAPFYTLETLFQVPAPDEALSVAGGPPISKTCVCSCGFPCKSDADCGPGGRCRAGITCCASAAGENPGAPATVLEALPAEQPLGP